MKSITAVIVSAFISAASISAQVTGQPAVRTELNYGNRAQDIIYDRAKIYLDGQVYLINGLQVVGSPFLYPNWNGGSIISVQEKTFSGYKLKYNVFSQTVFFQQGKDSLEVNEAVKQFILLVPTDSNTVQTFTFVHSDQFSKEKTPHYYEVLLDNEKGLLLKANQKIVGEPDNGLPVQSGKKVFRLDVSFSYFDKKSKKLTKIKGNGANIEKVLGLNGEELKRLGTDTIDFNMEPDLVRLFKAYFTQ